MKSTTRSESSAHGDQSQLQATTVPVLLVMTCSICFLSPTDPVVTSCGHMFCWQCLYLWLQRLSGQAFQCPVCRTELEIDVNIVPIYANYEPVDPGTSGSRPPSSDSDAIPSRPNPPATDRRMRRNLRTTTLRSHPPRAAGGAAVALIRHVDVEVHLDVEVSDQEFESDSELEVVTATAIFTYE